MARCNLKLLMPTMLPALVGLLLLLAKAGSCFGASLECHDTENSDDGGDHHKLACQLDMSYDEISDAFNLNCQPSETGNGLVCNFETLRDTTTKIVTLDAAKINICSGTNNDNNNNALCVRSEIQTQLQQGKSIRELFEKEEIEMNSDNVKDENEEEPFEFGIRIGNHRYRQPFEQYAAPVADALQAQAHLWKTSPRGVGHEYALANALLGVGIAHFTAVMNDDDTPGMYSHSLLESFDLKLSVNAFREAEKMYNQILDQYAQDKRVQDRRTVHSSMASLYLQWGEVYQNSHYYQDEEEFDDYYEGQDFNNDLALRYFEKSEQHYRLSIETAEDADSEADADPVLIETKVNLAHVCHRIGRCLVNSVQGTVALPDATSEAVSNALPHLQKVLGVMPKAEEKFEEAARLYRLAIEKESDFGARVQLKNYLTTTLQDHGIAASYVSKTSKAIELQQEGIQICKEILPHQSEENRQFMTQYMAESMLSISSLYMQRGQYDETNEAYGSAMDWYEKHNLEPAQSTYSTGYEVSDEDLEAYEKQLADYYDLKMEVSIPDGYADEYSGQPVYAPNDAFEGGLHAALGSLHLSRNEILMAIDGFKQAIRLYENDQTEQDLDRSIADVKTSLAAAYFQNGEYRLSAEAHKEAMDIYREVVGEGENPMLSSLTEQLGESGDLSEILGSTELSDLLDSDNLQGLLSQMSADDVSAIVRQLTLLKDKRDSEATDATSSESIETSDEEKPQQKIHEQLIDVEQIRQNALNATSMHGEL